MELKKSHSKVSVTTVLPAGVNTPLFDNARSTLNVRPIATPPLYSADSAAQTILHACEHPASELYAGGAGHVVGIAGRIVPKTTEAILGRLGKRLVSTPQSPERGDNFETPRSRSDQQDGPYGKVIFRHSTHNWLQHRSSKLRRH